VAPPGLKDGGEADRRSGGGGEELACAHLARQGFTILERNYRCRGGEVDIVARDGGSTVFIEVKERHGVSHGEGLEAVTPAKRRRIVRAARLWASAHGAFEAPLRFDVVAVEWTQDGPRIRHERGAFDERGR
jgi:putative endonuclease